MGALGLACGLFNLSNIVTGGRCGEGGGGCEAAIVDLFVDVILFISTSTFASCLVRAISDKVTAIGFSVTFFSRSSGLKKGATSRILRLLSSSAGMAGNTCVRERCFTKSVSRRCLGGRCTRLLSGRLSGKRRLRGKCGTFGNFAYFVTSSRFSGLIGGGGLGESSCCGTRGPLTVTISRDAAFSITGRGFIVLSSLGKSGGRVACRVTGRVSNCRCDKRVSLGNGHILLCESPGGNRSMLRVPCRRNFVASALGANTAVGRLPFCIRGSASTGTFLVCPVDVCGGIVPARTRCGFSCAFCFRASGRATDFRGVRTTLVRGNVSSRRLFSRTTSRRRREGVVAVVRIFSCNFVILVSLVTTTGMFGAVSAGVDLHHERFTVLGSINVARGNFGGVVGFRYLLCNSGTLLLNLPMSTKVAFLVCHSISSNFRASCRLP